MEYKPKILIVDDKKENLFALEKTLQGRGAEIIKASSGNDALKSTLGHEFAVAILDVQMPGMDGYELAEFLRSQKKTQHLPIIFMSAVYSSDYYVFKGYDAGAVDFIVKPYSPKVLISKVDVFLHLATNLHELQASEERFKTLVMTIPDIVYRIDREGYFTFVNDAIQRLGYDPEKVIGRPFSEIIFPPDLEDVSRRVVLPKYAGKITGDKEAPKLFDERRTAKRKTTGLEIRLAVKSSKEPEPGLIQPIGDGMIVVEVNSSGMYEIKPNTRNKIYIGTVGVIRDISERKRAEEALREAQGQLVRREKLAVLGQLAGGISHELRNPLGAIKNAAYFLNMALEDPEPEVKEAVEILNKEVGKSEKIISSLLDFTRPKEPVPIEVDVNGVVEGALTRITLPKNIEMIKELDKTIPVISADPDQLERIFGNLLLNAVQAMTLADGGREGGRLTIRSELSGMDRIAVSIADTGIGIPEKEIEKVFEPLYTSKAKGIGLGLALTKIMVQHHGGAIEIESEKGKGSVFRVLLPCNPAEDGIFDQ